MFKRFLSRLFTVRCADCGKRQASWLAIKSAKRLFPKIVCANCLGKRRLFRVKRTSS